MAEINDWSNIAANNNAAPPDGWPEGMNYSQVNDCGRAMMAAIKRAYFDLFGSLTATGTANTYSVSLMSGFTSYFPGLTFRCTIPVSNSGASTLSVNGIGARSIRDRTGAPLSAGALLAGTAYTFVFEGTAFRVLDASRVPLTELPSGVALTGTLANFTAELQHAGRDVGYLDTPINTQNGNYTLTLANRGGTLRKASGGNAVFTIPAASAVPFPPGSMIDIVNESASLITLTPAEGAINVAGSGATTGATIVPSGWGVLKKTPSRWFVSGAGVVPFVA